MKRRALLAAAGPLAAALAGCVDANRRRDARAERTTRTFDGTPSSELARRDVPEPPDEASPQAAVEFVRRYERTVLHNALVDELPDDDEPVRTEVSAVRTDAFLDPAGDGGVLVASDGSAHYRREDGGYTRNRALVVHHVADGDHRVQPYNAYRCEAPAVPTDSTDEGAAPAKFQAYDFSDGDGARFSVAVSDRETGERAFYGRYDFGELGLVVQPGVVAEAGRFDVSVATQSGGVDSTTWTPAPETPSWAGLTVFVLPGGAVVAGVFDPAVPASFPGDVCRRLND